MTLSKINIRATSLEEFWGDEYEDYRYLWQASLHKKSLTEINSCKSKVVDSPISNQKAIESGHVFCKDYYFQILPELAKTLNDIHGINLDHKTWGIAFGYWLYRHISIVYDKYITLSKIDLENSSIKLLCDSCYYVPENHTDYIFTFANDFGVQQLVSLYYRIFSKKSFDSIQIARALSRNDSQLSTINKLIAQCYRAAEFAKGDIEIALLGAFFSKANSDYLKSHTHDRISNITPPHLSLSHTINWDIRENLSKGKRNSDFDIFFWESMKHCLPMVYVENFTTLFDAFHKDILKRNFSYIASESWISDVWSSIYIATAKSLGKNFIAIEHAAGNVFLENGLHFIDLEFSDIFVSTGWGSPLKNVVRGGLMSKEVVLHKTNPNQSNILFVTFTRFIYWEEFNEENATDSFFLERIERIGKFADLLPLELKNHFVVRPRPAKDVWNVSNLLSLDERNIRVDLGKYSDSINLAKVIVIDHMSTGLAEILQNRIPFILLYDINSIPLNADLKKIFDQLLKSKVLHTTPDSAVEHLVACYSEIETWWGDNQVQESISQFTNYYLHPANRTISFLASLLKNAPHRKQGVFNCIIIYICNAFGFFLRALRLVARHIFTRRSFNN